PSASGAEPSASPPLTCWTCWRPTSDRPTRRRPARLHRRHRLPGDPSPHRTQPGGPPVTANLADLLARRADLTEPTEWLVDEPEPLEVARERVALQQALWQAV